MTSRIAAPRPPGIARARKASTLVTALVLAGLLFPAGAGAHAAFLSAQPGPGTRLQAGPSEISLTFTEPLSGDLTDGSLRNASTGERVPAAALVREQKLILRPQARLRKAPYEVDWHTVSTLDGHALEGSFSFGVRTAATGGDHTIVQSPLARGGWLRIAVRALFYVALLYFAGGLFAAALISRRDGPSAWLVPGVVGSEVGDRQSLAEGAWIRTLEAGWYAAAGAAAVALVEASDAAGGLALGGVSDYLLSSSAGLARAWTVPLLAIAALLARRMPTLAAPWLALAFLSISFSGHANSAELSGPAIVNDWLHLLAGGIWLGGIAQIALTWLPRLRGADPSLRRAVMRSVLPRFGEIAVPAFLLVAFTGVTGAVFQLGYLDALWSTAYGRVLMVKIALVGLIALASYTHAFRLRPRLLAANPHPPARAERRHWRLLSAEPVLGLAVLAAAAALVAFPLPPQQLGEADEAEAEAPCDPCPLPAARPGELAVAEQAGPAVAAFWLRREGGRLSGKLRVLDDGAKPPRVELESGELQDCGPRCWRLSAPGGLRRLTAIVTASGKSYRATVPARWSERRNAAARRLVGRTRRRMRALRSLRLDEAITSGPGSFVRVRYRFRAPDRMAYRTDSGARAIAIGPTRYSAVADSPWTKGRFGADGFRLVSFFRWGAYAQSVRWLGRTRVGGRRAVEVALYDRATPLWYRLAIEQRSGRVLRERLIAESHFMQRRFFAFNAPVRIEAPR